MPVCFPQPLHLWKNNMCVCLTWQTFLWMLWALLLNWLIAKRTISTWPLPQKRTFCLSSPLSFLQIIRIILRGRPLTQRAVRHNEFIPSQCANVWGLSRRTIKIVCKECCTRDNFRVTIWIICKKKSCYARMSKICLFRMAFWNPYDWRWSKRKISDEK